MKALSNFVHYETFTLGTLEDEFTRKSALCGLPSYGQIISFDDVVPPYLSKSFHKQSKQINFRQKLIKHLSKQYTTEESKQISSKAIR
mmetsp:Transcript_42927/g.41279  ORF Transcript_42927/g.41279 Transcript_42927/m.41279 type:complete len:88 (+) Transcript_42927:610-873(+)